MRRLESDACGARVGRERVEVGVVGSDVDRLAIGAGHRNAGHLTAPVARIAGGVPASVGDGQSSTLGEIDPLQMTAEGGGGAAVCSRRTGCTRTGAYGLLAEGPDRPLPRVAAESGRRHVYALVRCDGRHGRRGEQTPSVL